MSAGQSCSLCSIPATMRCTTDNTFLSYACIAEHEREPGEHIYVAVAPQGHVCSSCRERLAQGVCRCVVISHCLCQRCGEEHCRQSAEHTIVPGILETATRDRSSVERRQKQIEESAHYMSSINTQIQRAETQGMSHFNNLEQQVNSYREQYKSKCRELRAKTTLKVETALAGLAVEEDWTPPTVRVHITSSQVLLALAKSAQVELACDSPVLYHPREREIWRWDCCLRAWLEPMTLTTNIIVDKDSAWCFPTPSTLFVSGCRVPLSPCAYQIDTIEGKVTTLANMRTARGNHALVAHRGEVIAFGGYWVKSFLSCECYSEDSWSLLPNMNEARSHFSPCRLEDRVFLCGGSAAAHIEVFDWVEKSFRQLPQIIPPNWWTSAFVCGKFIIVLSTFQYYKWRIDSEELFESSPTKRMSSGWSSCPVQHYQDRVFILSSVYNTIVEVKVPEVKYITNYGFMDC